MEQENRIPRVTFEIEGDSLRVSINEYAAPDRTYVEHESRLIDSGAIFFKQFGRHWNRLEREATIRMTHEPRMTEQGVRRLVKIDAIKPTEDGIYVDVTRLASRTQRLICLFCAVSGVVFLSYMGLRAGETFSLSQAIAGIVALSLGVLILWLDAHFTSPRSDLDRAISTLKKWKASAGESANSSVGTDVLATQQKPPLARILATAKKRCNESAKRIIYGLLEELRLLKQLDFSDLRAIGDRISKHLEELGGYENVKRQTVVQYLQEAIELKGGQK